MVGNGYISAGDLDDFFEVLKNPETIDNDQSNLKSESNLNALIYYLINREEFRSKFLNLDDESKINCFKGLLTLFPLSNDLISDVKNEINTLSLPYEYLDSAKILREIINKMISCSSQQKNTTNDNNSSIELKLSQLESQIKKLASKKQEYLELKEKCIDRNKEMEHLMKECACLEDETSDSNFNLRKNEYEDKINSLKKKKESQDAKIKELEEELNSSENFNNEQYKKFMKEFSSVMAKLPKKD